MADSVTKAKLVICPYCGQTQPLADRCRSCSGLFEPLSRQATHNSMGPWFIRDENRPFQPGCSFETILRLIERGKITSRTIMRGPTTRQFWTIAKRVPGISHRLGICHECEASVNPDDQACPVCGAAFTVYLDRNSLGLPEYRPLPWAQPGDQHVPPAPDEGVAVTWSTPRPAEPETGGTISSFATDEEVMAASPRNGLPAAEPVSAEPVDETTVKPASSTTAAPASAEPDSVEAITMRTLRRRLALQQQSLQRQKILLLILGALAVIAMIGWTSILISGDEAPMNSGAANQLESSTTAETPPTGEVGVDDQSVIDPAADDEEINVDSKDGLSPVDWPVGSTRPEASDNVTPPEANGQALTMSAADQAEFDGALEKLSFSRDESQLLEERIAACEEAVATLTALAERFDSGSQPEELERRRQEAARQLERLRLRDYFP